MNERVKKLAEEISKLPPEEQADLMDELLVLTYSSDPEIDKAWAEEAQRRLQRYKSGLEPAYDAFEVIEDVRSRLARRRRT
jgi:hypothetical protein